MKQHKNLLILVVDDSAAIRTIVVDILRKLGLKNTIEAADGAVAWEILQKSRVGLVLSDVEMPVMDGVELLARVRGDKALHNIPFILITSVTEQKTVIKAAQSGVSAYLIKPFSDEAFKKKLLQVL